MNVLERVTEDEVKKLFLSLSSKSCDLEPIPTSVLKKCLDMLITPITDIINISMETSTFPQKFKETLRKVVADRLQAHVKITIYPIHYNQSTGVNIMISLLVWTRVKLQL